MGRRGPPPTPTKLRLLHGNPGKRAVPDAEPMPPPGEISAPSWLRAKARRLWGRIAPVLEEMGVLSTADPHALALLCDAYAEYIECRDVVRVKGRTYESVRYSVEEEIETDERGEPVLGEDGTPVTREVSVRRTMIRPRPEAAMAADAWRRVRAMLQEFGMTPASRSRVAGSGAGGDDEDEKFEELFAGQAAD